MAAQGFAQLRQLFCCERTQRENRIHGLGSERTNAAQGTKTRIEMANGRTVRQSSLDVDTFGDAQGVFEFNAKIANGTIDLRVTK